MRLVFAGTADFAVPFLAALYQAQYEISSVLTQPDRPAGRGRHMQASPVKQAALERKLPILQLENLKASHGDQLIQLLKTVDLMVVVAYGIIIPERILVAPRLGCINVHPSKLPQWRGAAPIQHSLLAGEQNTAISIIQMDAGMDSGPLLLQKPYPILPLETSGEMHERLAHAGAQDLCALIANMAAGGVHAVPQQQDEATYTKKIAKKDALIDWSQSTEIIVNQVRAYNPWPVTFTHLDGERVRIWRAHGLEQSTDAQPGTVLGLSRDGMDVATGDGLLRITELQFPGMKTIAAKDFVNGLGHKIKDGATLFK